mmetsp:Transcript_6868/g.7916  ORF Transcript_6868/g.7916 Transcript_6868/m.7916 type:complete len:105 (+) Transcript_6868:262-576(+)
MCEFCFGPKFSPYGGGKNSTNWRNNSAMAIADDIFFCTKAIKMKLRMEKKEQQRIEKEERRARRQEALDRIEAGLDDIDGDALAWDSEDDDEDDDLAESDDDGT